MKYLITSVAVIGLGFLILLAQSLSNTDLVSNDTFIVLLVISIAFVVCSISSYYFSKYSNYFKV
jgi:hypothetical protein